MAFLRDIKHLRLYKRGFHDVHPAQSRRSENGRDGNRGRKCLSCRSRHRHVRLHRPGADKSRSGCGIAIHQITRSQWHRNHHPERRGARGLLHRCKGRRSAGGRICFRGCFQPLSLLRGRRPWQPVRPGIPGAAGHPGRFPEYRRKTRRRCGAHPCLLGRPGSCAQSHRHQQRGARVDRRPHRHPTAWSRCRHTEQYHCHQCPGTADL